MQVLYYLHYIYQRTLEETGKRGQETYYLKSCLQLSCCLAFHRLLECTDIKVCLITSILVKPSSSRTLLVQTPQLTFVSRNRIPDISLHRSKVLQNEHSAILATCIKLPFVIKIFVFFLYF